MRARLAIAGLLALIVAAPMAASHANYFSSDPARGARLAEAPATVSVRLSEPVDEKGSSLEVRRTTGERVDRGAVRFTEGATPVLTVELDPQAGPGAYVGRWKALSTVDGHVTSGSFGFAVGGFEPPGSQSDASAADPVSIVARWLAYAGFAVGFGAIAFALYIHPTPVGAGGRHAYARALAASGALVAAGLASLVAVTVAEAGLGVQGFLSTEVGRLFAWRLVGAIALVAVGLVALRRGAGRTTLAAGTAVLLATAWGNALFAHSAGRGAVAILIDWAHLVSVATWLGGLGFFLDFLIQVRQTGTYEDVLLVGRRFSRVALSSVVVLGLTGLASTLMILGRQVLAEPWSLWESPYGSALAWKLVLFAAMVAVAGINRFVFLGERPGRDGAPGALTRVFQSLFPKSSESIRSFGRVVTLEATIGVAVLALAAVLTTISPPSDLGEGPENLELPGAGSAHDGLLEIRPVPVVGGASNVSVLLRDASNGEPIQEAVRIRITLAATGPNATGGQAFEAMHVARGTWTIGNVLFVEAGPHQAEVEVQTEAVYRDTLRFSFTIGRSGETGSLPDHEVYLHENPFHIAPERIEARAGQEIRVRVINAGVQDHDWLLCRADPEPSGACAEPMVASRMLGANETQDLRWVAPEPGTYEYYCTVPGHRDAGMRGEVLVEDAAKASAPMAWAFLLVFAAVAVWRARS